MSVTSSCTMGRAIERVRALHLPAPLAGGLCKILISPGLHTSKARAASTPRRLLAKRAEASKNPLPTAGPPRSKPSPEGSLLKASRSLFLWGALLGPPLDGIHGLADLLRYDSFPVDLPLGPATLHSSLWIPPLLGSFYAVLGTLTLACDRWLGGEVKPTSWRQVAASIGVLTALLSLSSLLYAQGVAYRDIGILLASLGVANWWLFDRTPWGLALGLFCALVAPASELVIIKYLALWHYPHPDVFGPQGFPSWVTCCYFFYTPVVSILARRLY